MNRMALFEIIYALAARGGRDAILFGDDLPLARQAFARSLAGEGFPELWFEIPLAGKPWFDFHALSARADLDPHAPFAPETCGGNPEAFAWFAQQDASVRQLALSWDTSAGDIDNPAVQLLVGTRNTQVTCDFLSAAGRADAIPAYRAFMERLPAGWYACYTGVFPRRTTPHLRVECIPDRSWQPIYAEDPTQMAAHLKQVGLTDLGDTLLPRCAELARSPFPLEFQFDVDENGQAGPTFGASVRFAQPPGDDEWPSFDPDDAGGALMRQVEAWQLADSRWRLLSDTAFAKRAEQAGESTLLFCYPAFLKLRWRNGVPVDAKAYIIAGAQ